MPITKDHAYAAGIIAAVALGAANLARTPASAPAPSASVAAPMPSAAPLPPSRCKQACSDLGKWCVAGRAGNCESLLTRFEREGKVSCDAPMTQAALDSLGWCPNGGAETTIYKAGAKP